LEKEEEVSEVLNALADLSPKEIFLVTVFCGLIFWGHAKLHKLIEGYVKTLIDGLFKKLGIG
jgi:hypothetical protein